MSRSGETYVSVITETRTPAAIGSCNDLLTCFTALSRRRGNGRQLRQAASLRRSCAGPGL